MAELFIVAEWVTSCQPVPSLMLKHFFFLIKKYVHTLTQRLWEENKKTLPASFVGHNELVPRSFFKAERSCSTFNDFSLHGWNGRKPPGKCRAASPDTLDLCFDQRFSRRPVDVSQVPLARCKGSYPCTWSGLWTGSCDACTGPPHLQFVASVIGQSGNLHNFCFMFGSKLHVMNKSCLQNSY